MSQACRARTVISVTILSLSLAGCGAVSAFSPAWPLESRAKPVAAKRTTSPCPCLFVTNLENGCRGGCYRPELTAYPVTADGDTPPVYDIAGDNTQLQCGAGVALDAAGNIYAADCDSIVVYAAGATGNVAPIRTIAGSNTQISGVTGVAIDASGNIYVADAGYSDNNVAVFAAGANGNVAPIRLIAGANTGLDEPVGLGLDSKGHIYVSNAHNDSITVYAAGANGDRRPIRTINGANTGLEHPEQLVVAGRTIIVANNPETGPATGVTAYPIGANGNVAPSWSLYGTKTKLFLPDGVAVDANGDVYVANEGDGITVYAPGSNGDVRPIRKISGHSTRVRFPQQLAIQ